jgi:hypothetical protein
MMNQKEIDAKRKTFHTREPLRAIWQLAVALAFEVSYAVQ